MGNEARDDFVRLLCIDDGAEWLPSAIIDLRQARFEYRLTVVTGLAAALRELEKLPFDFTIFSPGFAARVGAEGLDRLHLGAGSVLLEWEFGGPTRLADLVSQNLPSGATGGLKAANDRLVRQERQKKLEAIAAMERLTASERLLRLLELGIRELGHKNALVTDIDGNDATVLDCISTTETIYAGLRCPSEMTFCHHVLTSDEPIAIPNLDESYLKEHPARKLFGIESYLACRVSGNPHNQRTLCYVSDKPREAGPTDDDLDFIRGLAFRVDVELKNQEHELELTLTKALFDAFMNHSPVLATLKDAGGVFRYVNKVADPALGEWIAGFEGKVDHQLVSESDFGMIRNLDRRVLEHGETVQSRYPMNVPGHGVRYLHIIKFPVDSPTLGLCVGTVSLDITPQFEAKQQLAMAYEATLEGWTRTLDIRDSETQGHSRRVAELTVRLGRRLGVPEEEIVHMWRGAMLHDLGKIGIPDAILNKSGPLTSEEWEIMRRHPKIALDLLAAIPFLAPALDIPYCHHERWDGSGYPQSLVANDIPKSARIFAVVDVFDALTSDRPYRSALPEDEALSYIRSVSGVHFDPEVVDEFLLMMGRDANAIEA